MNEGVSAIKENTGKKKLKKHNMFGLPKNWLPVHYYNGNYYLYAPSDWGNAGRRILSDSVFINWYMDGPYPQLLQSVSKEKASTYTIKYQREKDDLQTLVIHIIDPKINLAVWEYQRDDGKPSSYKLYVAAPSAANFNMIVNHSNYQKQMEFKFQEPDYQKLLKMK